MTIDGAGSTWSYNAINNWITNVTQQGMVVNYQPVGSVSGLSEFGQGLVDYGASEIPYAEPGMSNPLPSRGLTYMPDTAGGIALMYNLTIGSTRVTNLRLSGATIAGIFTDKITNWDDPLIKADNPGLNLPNLAIVPVVRTDGAGSTWQFTQWMLATQPSYWNAYCAVVARAPCTPASAYPVDPSAGSHMIGQSGDLGVTGYVSQATADGAIGYTEYSYALETGFPVAKVLNAAGYYTAPTPDNVGVSLLDAQVDSNPSDPLYQTENLAQVYADTDPRTYELSYYSYMILPTDTSFGFSTNKGYTLGAFGSYLLCQGQQQVDTLGYAALPINLVEDGFTQLQRIPGNQVPTTTSAQLQGCNNPTLSNGADILTSSAPMPAACDKQGSTQCISTTTTLTAAPNPAAAGAQVTLTATESAGDGTTPPGTVQFSVGGTDIGAPVAVSATGVATTTTTFASGTESLSADFVPTGTSYAASTGAVSLVVYGSAGSVSISVTVPASGALTVTVATGVVNLAEQGTTPPATATGTLNNVTVADTRNTYPGWSVSGQVSSFTSGGSGATIPGDQLGWTPTPVGPLAGGATVGPMVAPGTSPNGLGDTAALLASAPSGQGLGTNTLSAGLVLDIPAATPAGAYSSLLTITYLESGP